MRPNPAVIHMSGDHYPVTACGENLGYTDPLKHVAPFHQGITCRACKATSRYKDQFPNERSPQRV